VNQSISRTADEKRSAWSESLTTIDQNSEFSIPSRELRRSDVQVTLFLSNQELVGTRIGLMSCFLKNMPRNRLFCFCYENNSG
jgi:hypothetical protein